MNGLEKFGNIPIDNAVLSDLTGNYKFPRNKVASMEIRGELIRLKKGLSADYFLQLVDRINFSSE